MNEDQAVTLEQAIQGFTLGGAQCLGFGWEEKLGSIEEGKLADFIVIDRNLFEIPVAELYQTQVDLTVLGGKVVYDRSTDIVDDLIDEEHFSPEGLRLRWRIPRSLGSSFSFLFPRGNSDVAFSLGPASPVKPIRARDFRCL